MTRVKRGFVARKRRNRILKKTKGFKGSHSNLFRTANQQAMKASKYASKDRHNQKRIFRRLWIKRINGMTRFCGVSYSVFIYKLKNSKIFLNRKILSQLSILDPLSIQKISKSI